MTAESETEFNVRRPPHNMFIHTTLLLEQVYMMHRCWNTREIVDLICNEAWNDKDSLGTKAVLSLAQTARSLNDIATDTIWYRIPDIEPLLGCSQSLSRLQAQNEESVDDIHLVHQDDLLRTKELAKRVRCLGPQIKHGDDMDDHVDDLDLPVHQKIDMVIYQTLHVLNAGQPLLPYVQDVNLGHLTINILPFVYMLTNAKINRLKLACNLRDIPPKDLPSIFNFLNRIGNYFPCLEDLDLHVINPNNISGVPEYIANIVCANSDKFKRLTRLCLGREVSSRIISHLLQHFENLASLCICVPFDHSTLPPTAAGIGLTHIKTIILHTPRLELATELLQHIQDVVPIRTLIIRNRIDSSTSSIQTWQRLIGTIHTKCSPEQVKELRLVDYANDLSPINHSPAFSLAIDALDRLHAFTHLEYVAISTCGTIDLDDSGLRKLVSSWSQLRELRLLGWAQISPPPKLTLDGLAVFSEYCPHLSSLAIEFYAHTDQTSLSQGRPPHQLSLDELAVYDSVITNPFLVAALLADMFPIIHRLDYSGDPFPGNEGAPGLWDQVIEGHQVISKVRADEARRLQVISRK